MTLTEHSVKEARDLWESGQAWEALAIYERQAKLCGPQAEISEGIGSCLWSVGRFDEALEAFTEARILDSGNPAHWSNSGLCLRDLGRSAEAYRCFEHAIKLSSSYAPAYNEWGNTLQDEGQYEKARSYYQVAISLDPKRAVYRHNYGVCFKRLMQNDDAKKMFEVALQLDPVYKPSIEELGILALEAAEYEKAKQLFLYAATPRANGYLEQFKSECENVSVVSSIPNVFSDQECADLCQYIRQNKCEWSKTSSNTDPSKFVVDESRRRVKRAPMTVGLQSFITERIQKLAQQLARSHNIRCTAIETPQLLQYREGYFFTYHQDGAYNGPSATSRKRVGTVVIGLNEGSDQFTGGDLRIFKDEEHAILRQASESFQQQAGRALFFLPDVFHDVAKIMSGERLTLTTWLLNDS